MLSCVCLCVFDLRCCVFSFFVVGFVVIVFVPCVCIDLVGLLVLLLFSVFVCTLFLFLFAFLCYCVCRVGLLFVCVLCCSRSCVAMFF